MEKERTSHRWVIVVIMFLFMLFHQILGTLIQPLAMVFRSVSSVSDLWLNTELPLDILFSLVFLIMWGIFFDRYSPRRLFSMAGFLWGVTAWLMASAPTFALFNLSRALSGIDRGSQTGVFAIIGDLFKPVQRGKIFGLLLMAQPMVFITGWVIANSVVDILVWRYIFLVLGGIGFLFAVLVDRFVKFPKRGGREPALADIDIQGTYQFDWNLAKKFLRKPSLILIYVFMLISTMGWVVISQGALVFWGEVIDLSQDQVLLLILPIIFGISLGFPMGGILGDLFFRVKRNGRIFVSAVGVFIPLLVVSLVFSSNVVVERVFVTAGLLVGFLFAFPWPNIYAIILDITLPELRASAISVALVFQTLGILISSLVLSWAQGSFGFSQAIFWLSIACLTICFLLLVCLFFLNPKDIEQLRRHMAYRSHLEARFQQK